jgi:hypothetical protein
MAIEGVEPRFMHLGTLTIPNTGTASGFIPAAAFGMCEFITVVAPAALTGTVALQVLADAASDETNAASWRALQQPAGTAVVVAQGVAVNVVVPAAPAIRLLSSGAEGAERVFHVYGRKRRVAS